MLVPELQNIVNKYKEFKAYLEGIDINDFKKYSRAELKEFREQLQGIGYFRTLSYEISQLMEEKKKEEFPQLLGVHHYPEIKNLDILSEEDKIELDKLLGCTRIRNFILEHSTAWRNVAKGWGKETEEKVLNFLTENEILEKNYKIEICHDCEIFPQRVFDQYLRYFDLSKRIQNLTEEERCEYEFFDLALDTYFMCTECGEEIYLTEEYFHESNYYLVYRKIKDRDKSWDDK